MLSRDLKKKIRCFATCYVLDTTLSMHRQRPNGFHLEVSNPSEHQGKGGHDSDHAHRLDQLDHALEQRRPLAQSLHHLGKKKRKIRGKKQENIREKKIRKRKEKKYD